MFYQAKSDECMIEPYNNNNNTQFLYCAFPIRLKARTRSNAKYYTYNYRSSVKIYKLEKRCVFKAFLKVEADKDCLIVSGSSFQYFEADTVNVLSPANERVMEYVRRRGSLADLNALVGIYKFKQLSKYFGA